MVIAPRRDAPTINYSIGAKITNTIEGKNFALSELLHLAADAVCSYTYICICLYMCIYIYIYIYIQDKAAESDDGTSSASTLKLRTQCDDCTNTKLYYVRSTLSMFTGRWVNHLRRNNSLTSSVFLGWPHVEGQHNRRPPCVRCTQRLENGRGAQPS